MAAKGTLKVQIVGDASKFENALKGAGGKMKTFAKGVGILGGALGIAGGAAFGAATKIANAGDEIAKGARAAGLSTDAYQELKFALGQAGLDAGTFDTAMKKLNVNIGDAANGIGPAGEAVDKLGVSLKDANGEMRSQDDIFGDLISGLEGVESSQERAALAADLFGARVGPDLASAIESGEEGIDSLRDKAHELGAVMSEDAAHSAEEFNDRLDDLKKGVGGLGREVFEGLLPAFTTGFEGLVSLMGVFREEGVGGLLTKVGEKLKAWMPVLVAKLKEWGQAFFDWAVEMVPPLLVKLADLLKKVGAWLGEVGVPALIEKLKEWATAMVEWVGPAIAELLPKLGELLGEVANWILMTGLPALIKNLAKWAWAFLDFIVTGVIPELPGVLAGVIGGLLAFIGGATAGITEKLGEWTGSFLGWIKDLPAKIGRAAFGLFDGIKEAYRSAFNWIIDKWNGLSFTIPSISAFGQTVGGNTFSTPNIPRLHSGGMFNAPTPGGEGLALLRDREMVVTPEQQGMGGVDIDAMARAFARELAAQWRVA